MKIKKKKKKKSERMRTLFSHVTSISCNNLLDENCTRNRNK